MNFTLNMHTELDLKFLNVSHLPFSQAYRWSGENSYFVCGDLESLQIGGGG